MPRTCKFANPLLTSIVLALFRLVLPVLGESDDEAPGGFKTDRYEKIWQRNPFTLVAPAVAQAQPTIFDKLVLLSWLNDGGTDVVFVQNTETNAVQKITKEPNADGLKLLEVHADPDPRKAGVVLLHGPEQGIVKFRPESQAAASQVPGSALAAGGQPPQGTVPGGQPPVPPRGQVQPNTFEAFQQASRTGPVQTQQGGGASQTDNVRPPRASEIRRKRVTAPPVTEQPVSPQQPSQNPANQPQGQ